LGMCQGSHDNFSGGPGNDAIVVWHKPAFEDIVVCGTGFDRVLADPKDVVSPDCERVQILQGPLEELLQQGDEFFTSPPIVALEAGLTPPPIQYLASIRAATRVRQEGARV
jgi:hypothetical protein